MSVMRDGMSVMCVFWRFLKPACLTNINVFTTVRNCRRVAFEMKHFVRNGHRRRSFVKFGCTRYFCRKIMYEKSTKCPNFAWYLPHKLSKCQNFYIFTKKVTKFRNFAWYLPENSGILSDTCPKIIFPKFCPPMSPMTMVMVIWLDTSAFTHVTIVMCLTFVTRAVFRSVKRGPTDTFQMYVFETI